MPVIVFVINVTVWIENEDKSKTVLLGYVPEGEVNLYIRAAVSGC